MRVLRWLRHEHAVGIRGRLDEVMGAYIAHDLGAGEDFDVELSFQLVQRLQSIDHAQSAILIQRSKSLDDNTAETRALEQLTFSS